MKKLLLVILLALSSTACLLAQRTINGTVSDEAGEALIGANVLVKGTASGTVTDSDGKFSVEVPAGSNVLVVSYTGFEFKEIQLGATNLVDIVLNENAQILNEVVVTALGFETQRSKLGVASSQIDGNAITRSGEVGLINSLAGKSAGINIVQSSGEPG